MNGLRTGQGGFTFEATAFFNSLGELGRPKLDKSVALALVDTANAARTKGTALIAKRTGLRSATVKSRIFYERVPVGQYYVEVKSSRRPIALIDFPRVRQVGNGVAVDVWGKTQVLRGAFIAVAGSGRQVFRREGRGRLPIKKLWGPTIYGTFATAEVQSVIRTTMQQRLQAALLRRIASAQRLARR